MREADLEALETAHRQPADRAVLRVAVDAIAALDERDDLLQQVTREQPEVEHPRLAVRRHQRERSDRGALNRVAVRHDHHHRLGAAIGNQVVEDDVRAAVGHPPALRLAVAVQQVVHRIGRARCVVAGRRVHPQRAMHPHRLRLVQHHPHLAVRHRTRVVECRPITGDLHEARVRGAGGTRHHADVRRVGKVDALDAEVVDPDLGLHRADGDTPDTIGALRHRLRALPLQHLANELDARGRGCTQAEGHRAIRVNFRRANGGRRTLRRRHRDERNDDSRTGEEAPA